MFLSVGLIVLLALVFGPSLWVKFVMKRYSSDRPEMPGTGGELAQHLIDRFELEGVKVEVTELGDHYDPMEKKVRLLREHFESKSSVRVWCPASLQTFDTLLVPQQMSQMSIRFILLELQCCSSLWPHDHSRAYEALSSMSLPPRPLRSTRSYRPQSCPLPVVTRLRGQRASVPERQQQLP